MSQVPYNKSNTQFLYSLILYGIFYREGLNLNDAQTGIELCGKPMIAARELSNSKGVLQEGAKNIKNLRNIR